MVANSKTLKSDNNGKPRQALTAILKQDEDSGFDRLLHERSRLAIVSALAVNDSLSFNDLKSALQISDGNLSVHARKLEEAGYIECNKSFEGRIPRTEYQLSAKGRAVLQAYIGHMEALIRAVKKN